MGHLKDGKGTISTQSGVLSEAPYSFVTRFENGKGTNPEELIAAAHAGCFTMALSAQLGTMNFTPESIKVTATVSLENSTPAGPSHKIHLDLAARIPGISPVRLRIRGRQRQSELPGLASLQSRNHA